MYVRMYCMYLLPSTASVPAATFLPYTQTTITPHKGPNVWTRQHKTHNASLSYLIYLHQSFMYTNLSFKRGRKGWGVLMSNLMSNLYEYVQYTAQLTDAFFMCNLYFPGAFYVRFVHHRCHSYLSNFPRGAQPYDRLTRKKSSIVFIVSIISSLCSHEQQQDSIARLSLASSSSKKKNSVVSIGWQEKKRNRENEIGDFSRPSFFVVMNSKIIA